MKKQKQIEKYKGTDLTVQIDLIPQKMDEETHKKWGVAHSVEVKPDVWEDFMWKYFDTYNEANQYIKQWIAQNS